MPKQVMLALAVAAFAVALLPWSQTIDHFRNVRTVATLAWVRRRAARVLHRPVPV